MLAAKHRPSIRRLRISQRVGPAEKSTASEDAAKARNSHGVERRTEVRIIETTPAPVATSTVAPQGRDSDAHESHDPGEECPALGPSGSLDRSGFRHVLSLAPASPALGT